MVTVNQVLDAVSSALNVIKTVAATPGVKLLPYASTISSAVSAIQSAYSAGLNVLPYVLALKETFSGDKTPTHTQIESLNLKIKQLEEEIQAAPPPAEEGEPE